METTSALQSYRSHTLSIDMQTSSGDKIRLDFANEQSASYLSQESKNSSMKMAEFSSMQAFSFSMQSNGIDENDQKELDAFMKLAQPYINKFLEELKADAPKSPVTQLANSIAAAFEPNKERSEQNIADTKGSIVKLFDDTMKNLKLPEAPKPSDAQSSLEKIFQETQKLLEKTLQKFDNFGSELYA